MYYGNPSALSQSNPDSVFDLFDDFDGTSIDTNKWTVSQAYGMTVSVSGGELIFKGTATNQYWVAYARITSIKTFNFPIILELYKSYQTLSAGTGFYFERKLFDSTYYTTYVEGKDTTYSTTPYRAYGYKSPSGTNPAWPNNVIETTADAFNPHTHKIVYDGSYTKWYVDGTLKHSEAQSLTNFQIFLNSALRTTNDVGEARVSWIRVRKFTDPEPTTTVDPEEVAPAPAVFTPIDELKKRLIFTTTPSFLQLSGSGSLNILSPSAGTKTLTVRNWWLITNATDGRITLASPSKLFGSLLAKKQKKTGQEDIWTTLGMGEPILLYYQNITPDSKVLVLVSWRED